MWVGWVCGVGGFNPSAGDWLIHRRIFGTAIVGKKEAGLTLEYLLIRCENRFSEFRRGRGTVETNLFDTVETNLFDMVRYG